MAVPTLTPAQLQVITPLVKSQEWPVGGTDPASGLPNFLVKQQPLTSGVGLVQGLTKAIQNVVTPTPAPEPTLSDITPIVPTADPGVGAPPWLAQMLQQGMAGGGSVPLPPGFAAAQSGGQMTAEQLAPERTSLKEMLSAIPSVTPRKAVQLGEVGSFDEFVKNPAAIAGLFSMAQALLNPDSSSTGGQIMGGLASGLQGVGKYRTDRQGEEDARFKGDMDLQKGAAETLGTVSAAYKDANTMNFIPEHLLPGSQAIKQLQAQAQYLGAQNTARAASMDFAGLLMNNSTELAKVKIQQLTALYAANPEAFNGMTLAQVLNTFGGLENSSFGRMSATMGMPLAMPPAGAGKDVNKNYILNAQTPEHLAQLEDNVRTNGFYTDSNILDAITKTRARFANAPGMAKAKGEANAWLRNVIKTGDKAKLAQFDAWRMKNNVPIDSDLNTLYTNAKAATAKAQKK